MFVWSGSNVLIIKGSSLRDSVKFPSRKTFKTKYQATWVLWVRPLNYQKSSEVPS